MTTNADRFWDKVEFDHPSKCWHWTAFRSPRGYGRVADGKRSSRGAHCVAWELWNESDVPSGKVVMHRCDVPSCVNPYHLQIGTQRDNMRDAAAKGRLPRQRGDANGLSKLTDADVVAIRARPKSESNIAVAAEFCVSHQLISRVRRGEHR